MSLSSLMTSLAPISSWDVYRRLDRIDDTMFTKEDADKMAKESREYTEKMAKESREYTEKMVKESREYAEKMAKEMATTQMYFSLFLAGISQILPVKQYLDSDSNRP